MRQVKQTTAVIGMALGAMMSFSGTGHAEGDSYPAFSGEISIEIQNDYAFDSDDPAEERNELGTLTEPNLFFHATENIYVNAGLTLEAVQDAAPGDDRVFDDHGVFVEVLTFNVEFDGAHIYGGKFGPNFSIAFDAAAGLYGTDISEDDIELSEFVGFGGAYTIGDLPIGSLTGSASIFTQDTSGLADSKITRRERTREADQGPGNTSTLESFAFAIDGEELPVPGSLRYHVGYARLQSENTEDESRFAIGAEWGIPVTDDITLTPLVEYVHFDNAGGVDGADRDYVTGSLGAEYGAWNAALAYTNRDISSATGVTAADDFQFQVSAGYAFDFGVSVDVGYKLNETADVDTSTMGALVAYTYEF